MVSLKEGMFNNANVVFRTKFVDGLSTVKRTLNDQNFDAVENSETNKLITQQGKKTDKKRSRKNERFVET